MVFMEKREGLKIISYEVVTELNVTLLSIFIPNSNEVDRAGSFVSEKIKPSSFQVWTACTFVHSKHALTFSMKVSSLNTSCVL